MKKIIPYTVIGVISLLIMIRCFYSFTWSDESFYMAVVHRLWIGERMFADEWYTTQLSAPLLLPFYMLYQAVTGGNEGVILYFRLLYWAISTVTSIFIYRKLKKYHTETVSLVCALIYLLYSRANIGGLSYYNMTLTMVLIASVWIYEGVTERKIEKYKCFISGILFALAVVCTPFLAFPYIIIVFYFLLRKKYRQWRREVIWMIVGTVTTAACYMAYVFSQVTMDDLLVNIPHILNEPEIQKTNPLLVIPLMCIRIAWRYKWTIEITVLLTACVLYVKRNKKSLKTQSFCCLLAIDGAVFIVNAVFSADLIGCINIACILFAIPVLTIAIENDEWDRAISVFGIAGISISLAFSFSSDTGLDAMTIGFIPIAMGAVLLLFKVKYPGENVWKWMRTVMTGVILAQSLILRIFSVYRDAPLSQLDTRIEKGPARHLYTTSEHVEQYETLYEAIDQYVRKNDRVFYSKQCFWGYLCTDNEYGVPSSWRMPIDSPRLEEYYSINPEKIPTCVFVLAPEYGKFESSLIQGNEKSDYPNENNLQGFLYDYMMENNYEIIRSSCGMIFRKREVDFQ